MDLFNEQKKEVKSLRDLANNQEDCGKLFLATHGIDWEPPVRGWYSGTSKHFTICGIYPDRYHADLTIHLDGLITQGGMHGKVNLFKVVDEIRKLGYDFFV